jgi:hypothetical protein
VDATLLRQFQRQVEVQCEFALRAAAEIDVATKKRDVKIVFYGIQNLLNAAANIHKALWGSSDSTAIARKPLRDSLQTDERSIFFPRTTVRNHNEHYDERIDRWWRDSKSKNFSDMNIGPRNTILGFDETDRFRWYDPETTDVLFWGDEFNLQGLVTEIKRIYPLAVQEANKPPR